MLRSDNGVVGVENTGYVPRGEVDNSATQGAVTDTDDTGEGLPCKWGPLTSPCCHVCRTSKVVLLMLSIGVCVQSMMVNGFVNVSISSWERRFDLSSTDTGLVVSCYDIATVLCLIPVTYFGGLGSKPRWLGAGFIVMAVAAYVCSLPHFVTDQYQYGDTSDAVGYCVEGGSDNSTLTELCSQRTSSLSDYRYVFILAMLLFGVGASPLYTLGVTYMDQNVRQKWASMYIGIFYAMALLGPAVGYILGGYFLTIYTDFDKVDTSTLGITENNVSWIGAWWLGFLVFGSVSLIIGLLILGFPSSLPVAELAKEERVSESYKGAEGVVTNSVGFGRLKDLPRSLKVLLTNPTFMLINLAGAAEGIVITGVSTFIPKYVENQYSVSASYAALLVGIGTVVGGGLGTLFAGYIIKRLRPSVSGLLKMSAVFCAISLVGQLGILAKCAPKPFAGISHSYNGSALSADSGYELDAYCNQECNCKNVYLEPVCGGDVMYFSACAAGCKNYTLQDGTKMYGNCSCVGGGEASVSQNAAEGRCSGNCQWIIVFIVVFVIILFFTFATGISELSATLRCVPEPQHSLSLGVQWLIVRCLGNIPGPVLYGTIIDQACLYWHRPCGDNTDGACYFYDNVNLGYYVFGITIGCKAVSLAFYILSWLVYKPPSDEKIKEEGTDTRL